MAEIREIPLMEFESDASAPILRYDVPSPSSYEGRNYIELVDIPEEYFAGEQPTNETNGTKAFRKPTLDEIIEINQEAIYEYLSNVSKEELEALVYTFGLEDVLCKQIVNLRRARFIDTHTGPMVALPLEHTEPGVAFRIRTDTGGGSSGGTGGVSGGFKSTLVRSVEVERLLEKTRETVKEEDTLERRYEIFKSCLEIAYQEGKFPNFYRTMGGRLKLKFVPVPEKAEPRLMFIETCKLTSYPGDYGAGTTIKTFSLLPGEETEISIKTWKKETTTTKEASSILDSYTEEKADEFEEGVQMENSNTSKAEESFSYYVDAEAKASWGFGSASLKGGCKGSSNSTREEASKNVMNATEKHSQKASSKRDVNVETSYERTADQGNEETITRRLKNLNASRTLNFVFRQMNQEFHSILHLTDVRVAFYNGYPGSMREYSLFELGDLLAEYMKPEVPDGYLENLVIGEYGSNGVFDYQGKPKTLVERIELPQLPPEPPYIYLRVIPPRKDEGTGDQIGRQMYVMREQETNGQGNITQQKDIRYVDGVILSAKKFTMRTDGIIVESLLGKAPALDDYALNTQIAVLRDKQLGNERIQAGLDLIEKLVDKDEIEEAVKAYKEMFVPQTKSEED